VEISRGRIDYKRGTFFSIDCSDVVTLRNAGTMQCEKIADSSEASGTPSQVDVSEETKKQVVNYYIVI